MWLEPPKGQRPKAESTKVRHDAPTSEQRKANRALALRIFHRRQAQFSEQAAGLAPKPVITFLLYATWYETHVATAHASFLKTKSTLKRLRAWFQSTPLHTIDRAAVLEWRTARAARVSHATVDRELDILKSLLAAAVPKYLEASPIRGLRRHRDTVQSKKRRPRILSVDEERRLLAVATDPVERAIILLALDTLMRLSDVKALRRDRDYGTAIHVEAPKVDPYDVPVSTRLRAALDALPHQGPFYFPRRWAGREASLTSNTVWRIFKRLCEAADIPIGRKQRGVTFHSLRHTGTTRMLEAGVNPLAVMEIGGWRELRQLVRYGRAGEETKRRAVELIGGTAPLRGRKKRTKR